MISNVDKIYDDTPTKFMMIHLKSEMQHLSQQMRNKRLRPSAGPLGEPSENKLTPIRLRLVELATPKRVDVYL